MEQYVKYLRKSRFDRDYAQLNVEETLKRHEAILDQLAQERGYCVVKTYYEVVSGESIAARPEIQKMLEEVSAGIYAGILVVDVERLARGNSADQAYISQVLQFSETKIITPTKVYDPCNEFDEEYLEFGLFMSRREYKTINRRLIRGRDSSAAEGKWLGSIAPYGYSRVKLQGEKGFTLQPHPEEAPYVQKIFSMYLCHQGTKQICNYLNDHRVPTRHGQPWSYGTVAQILENPVYMGKIRRGWSRQTKTMENGQIKKRIRREREVGGYLIYEGLHPALIEEEAYFAVQKIRKSKKPQARVNERRNLKNPFAGLLFCACCGKRVGRTTMSVERGSSPRLRCVNHRNCHNASASFAVVEKEIVEALEDWYKNCQLTFTKADTRSETDRIQEQLLQLAQKQNGLSAQLERAFNLVEQGVYTRELFQSRHRKLQQEIEILQQEQKSLQEEYDKLAADSAQSENLLPHTERLLESYAYMSNEERNEFLKEILEKITYLKGADGQIVIDLYPRLPRLL